MRTSIDVNDSSGEEKASPTSAPKSSTRRKAKSNTAALDKLRVPKRPKPYQLAAHLEQTLSSISQQEECKFELHDRISARDLTIVRQLGLEGLLLSIVCGRRAAPSTISPSAVASYRERIDASDAYQVLDCELARGFVAWIGRFDISCGEAKTAIKALELHLSEQARARRSILPRMPFDWNDAIIAIAKDSWLPLQMRSAAYSLRENNPILICAIETDPFRASIAVRKLLAPPQRCCEDELFNKWREIYNGANVNELRGKILPLVEAPLLKIANSDTAIGLRLLTLEGSDERLKCRSGAELLMLARTLPRQLLSSINGLNCESLISLQSYETLERACKREFLPVRASLFLGDSKRRYTYEEAEAALLTGQRCSGAFDAFYSYKSGHSDNIESAFMDVVRRLPIAVETCVRDRLEEIDPQKSPNLYQILLNALRLVRSERARGE